jgi:RND family efflux transporter MFP subunit
MNKPMAAPRTLRRAALAASGMLLAAGVLAAGADATALKLSAEQSKALAVQTAPIEAHGGGEIAGLPAVVAVPPGQQFVVAAPLAGMVDTVLVSVDGRVRKGQTMARLLSPDLAEMARALIQSATQLELARANLKRDENLLAEGIIGESRLRESRGRHAEATAEHAQRRQALRLAGLSDQAIARIQAGGAAAALDVAAPADGVVIEQSSTPGQRVDAAAPLFRVARLDPLWLEIQLPVSRSAQVAEGAAVSVPALGVAGRVLSVGRSTGAGQTILVRAEIAKGAARLRPGQFVEATIAAAAADRPQWSVPNQALIRLEGRTLVLVQTADGFRAEPVRPVSEGQQRTLVTGALKGGDRIAVSGVAALKAMLSGIGGE